ncbi:hypothetical protein M0R45_017881 [Rubus argutus]|uniref:Uncharacterized protein n=1 Tax=Rubus argutus TaxID=59490 RepID=A0AAW1XXM8_RUBAR
MALQLGLDTLLLGLLVILGCTGTSSSKATHGKKSCNATSLSRSSFPAGFIFGAASAAYQYEGAANEAGRGPCVWDAFAHKYPGDLLFQNPVINTYICSRLN